MSAGFMNLSFGFWTADDLCVASVSSAALRQKVNCALAVVFDPRIDSDLGCCFGRVAAIF